MRRSPRAVGPSAQASRVARLKLALLIACFVGFTTLGVWSAAPPGDVLARFTSELAGLPVGGIVLLIALAIACIVTEMFRMQVFGRVVGTTISLRAAFDASIANDLFTWISPGGLLGEPAAIWFMTRRGVPSDAALAISFGKFATSFALFIGLAAILFAAGWGPAVASSTGAVVSITLTIGFGFVLIGGFLVGAMRPALAHRIIDRIQGASQPPALRGRVGALLQHSIDRLAAFRHAGLSGWLAITGSHLLYYASYIGLFAALAWIFHARSIGEMVPVSIVYQAFAYIAPAPGIPEAGANVFFDELFPGGNALVVVILFRGLTAYLQIALGLIYLPIRAVTDELLSRPARR